MGVNDRFQVRSQCVGLRRVRPTCVTIPVMRFHWILAFALACLLPTPALAQVTLMGDYIRYANTAPTGSMIVGSTSMQYRESATEGTSCDAFFPGSPVEQFSIEGTAGTTFSLTNTATIGAIATSAGPAISGRTMTWSGAYAAGATSFSVAQVVDFDVDARHLRYQVTITNTGTRAITNLYYMRDADPDHGSGCPGGTTSSTDNDVRRQIPADESALVTAGARGGAYYVIGLGTYDPRARVSAGGFANTQPSRTYSAPQDPNGASGDISFDVVFLEPNLAVSASTTFEFFYVWGTTVAQVEERFDAAGGGVLGLCAGMPELSACTTSRGLMGTCHGTVCCTGCWDGTRCVGGRSSTACGVGGGACASCSDGVDCSSDVCTAGVCSNPDAPLGTSCNDSLFCTRNDTCDGRRVCIGRGDACDDASACTIDTCSEATDTCANTVTTDRCLIGGECVANGALHPAYPCLTCDPMRNRTDWSPRSIGTTCGEANCRAGRLTMAATCTAAGQCVAAAPTRCAAGYCESATSCAMMCTEGACPGDSFCGPSGACEIQRTNSSSCASAVECASGHCVDGICCDAACDGVCESCRVPSTFGVCSIVPAMTDPDGECGPSGYCDGTGACSGGDAGMLTPDSGTPDAGGDRLPDAFFAPFDAGTPPDAAMLTEREGCACHAGGTRRSPLLAGLLLGLALLVRRRR